jgi:hypothetical protein
MNSIESGLRLPIVVSLGLCLTFSIPSSYFLAHAQLTAAAQPWSKADERPEKPSALGRFGDSEAAFAASRRGSQSMGGGMERTGRWHLTVRRPYQPSRNNLPDSEAMDYAAGDLSPTYETSEALIEAFASALEGNEIVAFADLLGLRAEELLDDGAALQAFVAIRNGVAEKLDIDDRRGSQILLLGEEGWPFPYPAIRDDDGNWSFDTLAGLQEIVNRRIGENELEAIAAARAYLDAQHAYAKEDRDGDGVREYAQSLVSGEDMTDGLYWPEPTSGTDSPVGEFARDAEQRGGYYGYRFRILKGQGENATGGSHGYVINGNMIAGFALLAWPARYAQSGLNSFVISHHGNAYEADLGEPTAAIAPYISEFDPVDDWSSMND